MPNSLTVKWIKIGLNKYTEGLLRITNINVFLKAPKKSSTKRSLSSTKNTFFVHNLLITLCLHKK